MPAATQPPVKREVSTQHADRAEDAIPPPAYNSPAIWDHGRQQPWQPSHFNEMATSPSLTYTPPSPLQSLLSHQQFVQQRPGTRLLHIHRNGFIRPNLTIKDHDQTTVAYTVAANHGLLFRKKPHMLFYRGPIESQLSAQPIGTATLHHFRQLIDIELRNRAGSMQSTDFRGYSYQFQSGMGPLVWKSGSFGNPLTLMTPNKEFLAKLDTPPFSHERRYTLEIAHWDIPVEGMDEIVVTGIAMMEQTKERKSDYWT